MKFDHLTIDNFGTIGKAELKLSDRGLVLIQGENQTNSAANSNGAGKSTVVEAISWALYGKTAKGQTGDSVVNRAVGKNCRVALEITDDTRRYEIIRHRKHSKGKNMLRVIAHDASGAVEMTKGNDKLTQLLVDQVIGCSYDVFTGAVYAGQEKMPDLPAMTDKQLKLLIEEAAGITVLDQAYVIARNRLAERKQDLEKRERALELADTKIEQAKLHLNDSLVSQKRWNAERDARIIDLEVEARTLLRDAKAMKESLAKHKSEAELLKEREKLKERVAKHERETAELARLEAEANKAERAASGLQAVVETLTKGEARLKAELETLEGHIGKPCKACDRPHDAKSLASAICAKQTEMEDHKRETQERIKQHKDAAQSAQDARQSALDFKRDMTDLSRVAALSDALSERLANRRMEERAQKDKVERATKAVAAIKKERAAVNPYDAQVETRQKDLDEARNNRKEMEDAVEPARKAVAVASSVVDVYSPKGVRAHILDTVTPYLNERTAHYLGALADGEFEALWQTLTLTAKGEPRENFSINVSDQTGGSFADLSGGEKRKVRIACALALQDLVATRASKSLDLFIADEIDAALDTSALERLMGVLDEKARERGSVFIISHSDLRDWCSNCLTVVKENGMSAIRAA